jgi:hypothetical protein
MERILNLEEDFSEGKQKKKADNMIKRHGDNILKRQETTC